MPAGTETTYIPTAFLLSATHKLYLSILLTLSLSCSHPPGCLHFLSPPPSLLLPPLCLSLCSLGYTWHIAFFPPLFVIHPNLLLCFPSLCLSLSFPQSVCIFVLSPACIPLCLLFLSVIACERILRILVCFSGLLTVPLLSSACHIDLHTEYTHIANTHTICMNVYQQTNTSFLSITTSTVMLCVSASETKMAPYGIYRGVTAW